MKYTIKKATMADRYQEWFVEADSAAAALLKVMLVQWPYRVQQARLRYEELSEMPEGETEDDA